MPVLGMAPAAMTSHLENLGSKGRTLGLYPQLQGHMPGLHLRGQERTLASYL